MPVNSDNISFVPALGAGDLKLGCPGFVGDLKEVRIWKVGRPTWTFRPSRIARCSLTAAQRTPDCFVYRAMEVCARSAPRWILSHNCFIDNLEYWTLECWVKSTGSGCLISRWNSTQFPDNDNDFNYYFGIDDRGRLVGRFAAEWVEVTTDSSGKSSSKYVLNYDLNTIHGAMPVNDGQWHHVAYVRNTTNVLLYVDGELDAKAPNAWWPHNPVNTVILNWHVRILDGPVVIGTKLIGDMDEIRIWKRGLSTKEIREFSRENLLGTEEGLDHVLQLRLPDSARTPTNARPSAIRRPSTGAISRTRSMSGRRKAAHHDHPAEDVS